MLEKVPFLCPAPSHQWVGQLDLRPEQVPEGYMDSQTALTSGTVPQKCALGVGFSGPQWTIEVLEDEANPSVAPKIGTNQARPTCFA